MEGLVIYGTELEELDDEKSGITNKRPVGIEEQVVKDERGRRRFHGAFTGGFSAGYFNTVGSREGWEPKQFRSSRDDRGERIECKPEDFMDQEDLSEFGIAARRVKPSAEVVGESSAEKHLLAWERSTQSSLETSLSVELQKIIRPTSDSVGIQLLKKMGWREGQGIGAKMSRRALEKQKVNEERIHGKEEKYNEDAVREADEMAPNFMFAPNDLNPFILKSYEGVHGLGYRGLQQTSVLSEKYGTMEATLKFREKGKGISGQAFGVGAFEDDDENIYTNYDFSQYDFAIDGRGTSSAVASCSSSDTTFVMASKRQPARQFYEPPRIPPNFRPVHTPIYPDISQMPNSLKQFGEKMNHFQRAKFLGEVDPKAVLELIHDRDREKLSALKKEDVMKNAFEEEPMKQARFKQYVNYLKRGLNFPKPTDLTTLEWEQELNDFQNILPPELRSLIPEVKMRQKPLARMSVASPIADVLKLKFTSASSSNSNKMKEMKNDERLAAVKLKMFGEKTRSSYDWYPAKQLTKRFNVPDPYPSSSFVGVPHLQKAIKTETLANLGADILAFGSTQQELAGAETPTKDSEEKEKTLVKEDRSQEATINDEKPSEEFLKAIFGDSDESDSDDEESEGSQVAAPTISPRSVIPANDTVTKENNKAETAQKVITVMDLPLDVVDDGKEFGPAPPPECILSLAADLKAISKSNKKGKKKHKHSKRKAKKEESERSRRDKHKKPHYHHGRRNRGQDSSSTIFID